MIRQIISIDESKCNGCGICADACHEGAIVIENGKAKLLRDDYCDGLGDCLPACPKGAITFVQREAAAYDEDAVAVHMAKQANGEKRIENCISDVKGNQKESKNWPVQIKLAPAEASYFAGADLLIAADCTAYAYENFHSDFIKERIALIGCPKLDSIDYSEKLTEILRKNDINSITLTRMTVPCCRGLENAVKAAAARSGKNIPLKVVMISTEGQIIL